MKRIIFSIGLLFMAFKAEEKTASLKFTQQQYEGIKANFIDALAKNDSIKIAISFLPGDNSKIIQMLDRQKQDIINNGNFVLQIDSVFADKKK